MKIKKRTLKKLKITLAIVLFAYLLLSIFATHNILFAADGNFGVNALIVGVDAIFLAVVIATGGLALILVYAVKLIIVVVGLCGQALISGAAASLDTDAGWCDVEDIIFSGADGYGVLFSANFLKAGAISGPFATFQSAIAKWYYILRLIAAAALLVILVYIGIRMAAATVGEKQAKYKEWLVNWVVSLALLFMLHYIIEVVFAINSSLVQIFADINGDDRITGKMLESVLGICILPGVEGIFAALIYLALVGQIFSFFLYYLRRLITIGFLIMISPLICITYSIDKIGDGRAQALNTWLKELISSVIIQPFHCVIFIAFMGAIKEIIDGNIFAIGAYVLALMVIKFMKEAEKIVKQIFNVQPGHIGDLGQAGQSIANATGTFAKAGMAVGSAAVSFKNAGGFKKLNSDLSEMRDSRKINKDSNKQLKSAYEALKKDPSKKQSLGKDENGTERFLTGSDVSGRSWSQFKNSEEGQAALKNLKSANRYQLQEAAQEKRIKKQDSKTEKMKKKKEFSPERKRTEKKIEEEATENARKDYESKNGSGSFDKLSKSAQSQLVEDEKDKIYEKEHDKVYGAGSYKKTKDKQLARGKVLDNKAANTVFNTTGGRGALRNIKNEARTFSTSKEGRWFNEKMRQGTTFAVVSAMGAMGYGYGELNDAISAGQGAYGIMKGVFSKSTGTVEKDGNNVTDKMQSVRSRSVEGMESHLMDVKHSGDSGRYEKMYEKIDKFENKIARLGGNTDEAKTLAQELAREIQRAINDPDVNQVDIKGIIENLRLEYPDIITEENVQSIENASTGIAENLLDAAMYSNMQTAESLGMPKERYIERISSSIVEQFETVEEVINPPTVEVDTSALENKLNSDLGSMMAEQKRQVVLDVQNILNSEAQKGRGTINIDSVVNRINNEINIDDATKRRVIATAKKFAEENNANN